MINHQKVIRSIIWNSLDLCGSWADEVKDYCKHNSIDYEGASVQEACFIAVKTYERGE